MTWIKLLPGMGRTTGYGSSGAAARDARTQSRFPHQTPTTSAARERQGATPKSTSLSLSNNPYAILAEQPDSDDEISLPPDGLLDTSIEHDYIDMDQLENREEHEKFMREAIKMGELALQSDETPVGCVFVHKGEIIGRGMNDTNKSMNGTRHAEFVGLQQIMAKFPPSVLKETDLYVTVEPCIMCASALRQLGIRGVYFGCFNDRFGGTGGVLKIHTE